MLNTLKNLISPTNPTTFLQNHSKKAATLPTIPATTNQQTSPTKKSVDDDLNQLKSVKLIMVTAENNNKFYEMQENTDDTFTVVYGRIGMSGVSRTYPIRQWDKKYKEKIKKGYRDLSRNFRE